MNYILFDGNVRNGLLPFTYTRPVAEIRVGILTLREKWEKRLGYITTTVTEAHLEEKYPMVEASENVFINASFFPTDDLVAQIKKLSRDEVILKDETIVAFYSLENQEDVNFETYTHIQYKQELLQLKNTWDIFSLNDKAIAQDFELLTNGRASSEISEDVQVIGKENIFIEEGATLSFCSLNASKGPIYIGKNSEIMEGCTVRGPFAMCKNSVLKMGTRIYGATTLGPFCKVGGEVNNSVLFGYSNKGHEGYLGNSVLGEWCNLGADTNTSNLKNNYAEVKLWSYESQRFAKTGLQFCGLMMGDHSKCGINAMFNTGTVIGVSANIFGSGFPRNFIPSFIWGGAAGYTTYQLKKAFEVMEIVMRRKGVDFNVQEQKIITAVFEQTKDYRAYAT